MRVLAKIVGFIFLTIFLLACAMHVSNSGQMVVPPQAPGSLRIATQNVHYILLGKESGPWSVGDWNARKASLDDAFKVIAPDVMAFQEMESFAGGNDGSVNLALDYLLARNPDYAAAAVGDWRTFPSTQPILFRQDRLKLLDHGWFFFSETPDKIYSRTFNGSYPAFASWAKFSRNDGGRAFFVFNVHFEYKSRSNRIRSAELVRERIAPFVDDGQSVVLVGDVNARLGSRAVGVLAQAGLSFAEVRGATYHFNRGVNLFGAIDQLATTSDIRILGDPVVLRERFRGQWSSDHYPVFADFSLPE